MRRFGQRLSISTVAAALVVPAAMVIVGIGSASAATCGRVPSDFNGDGHGDVAVGEPFRTVAGQQKAGAVRIVYGRSTGLTTTGNQYFDESSFPPIAVPVAGDEFGAETATGYFNSDCYADLAVGSPGGSPGAVVFVYGSASGLVATTATRLTGTQVGMGTGGNDGFGSAMATGDFNGDGMTDLAIGAYNGLLFNSLSAPRAGFIGVLYGAPVGLTISRSGYVDQDTPNVPGTAEAGDRFGWALAAGDFNGDGVSDLAVGVPGEDFGTATDGGTVTVLLGRAPLPAGQGEGISGTGSTDWTQNSPGVPGTAESGDQFGYALAAANVTGDGKADIIVGTPDESLGTLQQAGSVTVLPGAPAGATGTGSSMWTQGSPGVPGGSEAGDLFGARLLTADFNGDGHADVAIGAPGESIGTLGQAGAVTVLYGTSSGITGTASQLWSQDSGGIAGASEADDNFGASLQAVPVISAAGRDLVVGTPGEDSGGLTDNGAIAVLRGGATGLSAAGNQFVDAVGLLHGAQTGGELSAPPE